MEKIQVEQELTDLEYRLIFSSLDKRLGNNADGTSRIIDVFAERWTAEIFG